MFKGKYPECNKCLNRFLSCLVSICASNICCVICIKFYTILIFLVIRTAGKEQHKDSWNKVFHFVFQLLKD